jgi:hypothetical protein
MEDATKLRLRFLAGFAVYFTALWLLWNTPIIYPLKIFVVLLHEISHGVVAVATGGAIERIVITPDEGGLCQCSGGSPFLILSAGYLGSLGWGALILVGARSRDGWPRACAGVIGVAVLAVTLLYVRNVFGLVFGLGFGVAILAASRRLSLTANRLLLTALGLTSCLYAILDIKSDVLDRRELVSDARMLATLTGVPTLIWGVLWIGVALAASAWLLRWALRRAASERARRSEIFRV